MPRIQCFLHDLLSCPNQFNVGLPFPTPQLAWKKYNHSHLICKSYLTNVNPNKTSPNPRNNSITFPESCIVNGPKDLNSCTSDFKGVVSPRCTWPFTLAIWSLKSTSWQRQNQPADPETFHSNQHNHCNRKQTRTIRKRKKPKETTKKQYIYIYKESNVWRTKESNYDATKRNQS